MNTQQHDESGRTAVIGGPHGNPTKRHALAMATELAERTESGDRKGREREMVMVEEPGHWLARGDI